MSLRHWKRRADESQTRDRGEEEYLKAVTYLKEIGIIGEPIEKEVIE
ncbi:MAG: hypothetical protein ACE5NJ_01390 [Thermodesulfobacteriota bacterium]